MRWISLILSLGPAAARDSLRCVRPDPFMEHTTGSNGFPPCDPWAFCRRSGWGTFGSADQTGRRGIKLATELQRSQRGETLYVLDAATTGLHPSDVAKLMKQLDGLVESGNIVVEHDMGIAAANDWF